MRMRVAHWRHDANRFEGDRSIFANDENTIKIAGFFVGQKFELPISFEFHLSRCEADKKNP